MSSVLSDKLSRQLKGAVSRYDELPDWIKSSSPLQASGCSVSRSSSLLSQRPAKEPASRKKK